MACTLSFAQIRCNAPLAAPTPSADYLSPLLNIAAYGMSCVLSPLLANVKIHLNRTHTLLCRKSKAPIGSSGLSQPSMPGHGVHWDVSQTRASATTFSIGSGTAVQRSGASMNSVGTHLGSSSGQGLVSATYSPLSHQGSLLRKDVDNQKNLRQADLNSVKRTPLSLKVGSVSCSCCCCRSSCPSASCPTTLKAKRSAPNRTAQTQLVNTHVLSQDAATVQVS